MENTVLRMDCLSVDSSTEKQSIFDNSYHMQNFQHKLKKDPNQYNISTLNNYTMNPGMTVIIDTELVANIPLTIETQLHPNTVILGNKSLRITGPTIIGPYTEFLVVVENTSHKPITTPLASTFAHITTFHIANK